MNEKRIYSSGKGGFSLIELMIAMVILAVGLLGVIQLQVSAMSSLAGARHKTIAIEIAERQMELLKTLPYQVDKPSVAPLDADSNPILDAGGNSIFSDGVNCMTSGGSTRCKGDYKATLHWDWPVDENGRPVMKPDKTLVSGRQAYILAWTIERGGSLGTDWPASITPPSYLAPYTPGPNQMRIRVIVGWLEPYERLRGGRSIQDLYNTTFPSELAGEYDYSNPGGADPIGKVFEQFPHRVVLECVRDHYF
jgi:prepilin-type N-terminal cleavage/methylation domain-containing protein